MTKKRFILDDCGELIDVNTHKFIEYGEECCNLLNKLHEENVILKKVVEEDDVLIKSLLSAYCNEKWEDFCKSYGIDLE